MPDPARMPPTPSPGVHSAGARYAAAAATRPGLNAPHPPWLAGAVQRLSGWLGLPSGTPRSLSLRQASAMPHPARAFGQSNEACVRQRIAARLMADCALKTQVSGSVKALIHLSSEYATAPLRRHTGGAWTTRALTDTEVDTLVERAAQHAQRLMCAKDVSEVQQIIRQYEN